MNGHICGGPEEAVLKLWRPLKQPLGHRPCFLLLLPLVEWSTWKMMPLMRWLRTVIGNCDCDCIDPSAKRPLICHSCYLSCCWWGQKPLLLHSKKYMLTSNQSMALRYILCGLPSILSNNIVFYRIYLIYELWINWIIFNLICFLPCSAPLFDSCQQGCCC